MKIAQLFYGVSRDGKIVLDKPEEWALLLRKYDGRELAIFVRTAEQIRTSPENRYYWGVIVKICSDEMGVIPDEAHDFLKSLFLKRGVEIKGKRWEVIQSTATLMVSEFEDYCEKCRQWMAVELGVVVPLPGEVVLGDEEWEPKLEN